jgi:hypothetical protein
MRVRCISDRDQRLTVGQDYLVLGLTFEFDPGQRVCVGPQVYVLLDSGRLALCDLAVLQITDPHASRYWQVRLVSFENRQYVDILPPELFSMLNVEEDDQRSGLEQDRAFFEALRSDEFRRVCALLQAEQAD